MGRAQHFTIRQNQLNGALEVLTGDLGEAFGNFLIRCVLNQPASQPLPEPDPDAAEAAIAVEDQERPRSGLRRIPRAQSEERDCPDVAPPGADSPASSGVCVSVGGCALSGIVTLGKNFLKNFNLCEDIHTIVQGEGKTIGQKMNLPGRHMMAITENRVLVFGATGQQGGAVARHLLANAWNV